MPIFSNREQIIIIILIAIIILLLVPKVFNQPSLNLSTEIDQADDVHSNIEYDELQPEGYAQTAERQTQSEQIKVYITGAVNNPGVIELKKGDRIEDAVKKAGGLKQNADSNYINLAKKVNDEDKIYIPEIGEHTNQEYLQDNDNQNRSNKVNINTADQQQLETLPGIGPVKAQSIIEYREQNGYFDSIEDIMNVNNIGEKTYENIKGYICID